LTSVFCEVLVSYQHPHRPHRLELPTLLLIEWRPIVVRLVDQPAVCVSTALHKYSVAIFL